MVHDFRPALAAAIRSGANRRGALAALLGAIPLAAVGALQADAARGQRHGKRAATSEGKKKKKAIPGPAGPQGAQGPAGARGPEGPKAITSTLEQRSQSCPVGTQTGDLAVCVQSCDEGHIAISGGFATSETGGVFVYESRREGNSWVVKAVNTGGFRPGITTFVDCLPT
jgi:hypothetical protein